MAVITVRSSGGDYATLKDAVDNATASDTISIEGTWGGDDTNNVTWDVATSVTADASSKQIGRPFQSGDTHYRLRPTSGHVFTVTANVDITNLDIQSDSSGVSDEIFRSAGSSSITATNCMLGFTGNTDQQDVIYTENCSTKSYNFVQCFIYDVGRSIIDLITGGQTGTVTMNFNSCGSYNIGANGGRANAGWVGSTITTSGSTFNINQHNCLIHHSTTYANYIESLTPTINYNGNYCITNTSAANLILDEDSSDETGSVGGYTWTAAADPGAGDRVGLVNITSGTYNPALTDHANNDAIAFHAVVTDAGLTIPDLDILGQTRDKTTPSFDVGPSAVTLASGGAFTLVANGGSYSISGSTASLLAARTLTASTSSYTLTGTDAGVFVGRNLSAGAGSYTVTGDSVSLLATRTISADGGSYTITGQDTGLLHGRYLSAGSGVYTVTGQDITALATRLIAASSGSYTLTGTDATLTYTPITSDYVLTANAGSYALSGGTADLLATRLLTSGEGSYVVTGQVLQLLKGYMLSAEAGSYVTTGDNAAFLRTYNISAGPGVYTIAGQNVTLTYSGAIASDGLNYIIMRRRRRSCK